MPSCDPRPDRGPGALCPAGVVSTNRAGGFHGRLMELPLPLLLVPPGQVGVVGVVPVLLERLELSAIQ